MLVRGADRIELGFTQGMKDNIAALNKAMESIAASFASVSEIAFIVTAMNNAGGEAVKSLSKTMTMVFDTAKPIIDPNFC
jgi:hypothetical protein